MMEFESFLRLGVDSRDVRDARKDLDGMSNSADRAARESQAFGRVASRAFGLIGAALSANQIRQYTDNWTDLNSRILNATKSQEAADQVMDSIGQTARRTYSSLRQTADTFLQNNLVLKELGYTTKQQIDFSDALNNSLVISGTKGQAATVVMSAMGRAMAEGTMKGNEFNLLMTYSSRTVEALAASLGVNTLKLREMVMAGEITGDKLYGITTQMELLRKEADEMPATIGDGFLLIDNALQQFIGRLSQTTGASSAVADKLVAIADGIDDISASLASGQGEKYIQAWVSQWDNAANDIGNAIEFLSVMMNTAAEDTSFNWKKAFLEMPANLTAMVQIIAVEIASIVDYAILYGGNVHKVFIATFNGVAEAAKTAGSVIWDNLNPISNSRDFMAEVTGAFTKPFDELTKKSQESADIIASSRQDSIMWIMAERDAVLQSSQDQMDAGDKLRAKWEEVRKSYEDSDDAVNSVNAGKNKHQKSIDEMLAALDDEVKALEKGEIGWLAYQLQQKGATEEEIAQAVAAKQRAISLRNLSDGLDDLMNKSGLFTQKSKSDANVVAGAYAEMINRIDASFATAFRDIMDGSTDLFSGLLDGFKDMVANMAYEASIKPIMLNIQQSMTGNAVGAAGAGGSAGGLGGMAAGGWMAIAAVAVIAAGSAWNKEQDKKFEKMTAAYRQGTQSTGTLLGDANKKSQSLLNSIETLQSIGASTLDVNYGMYQALIAIREGIAGAAASFAKSGIATNNMDITTGTTSMVDHSSFSPARQTGDQIGNIADKVSWGKVVSFGMDFMASLGDKITKELFKKKVTIADSGIQIMGAGLADILSGSMIEAFAYADIQTKKKIFGLTTSNKIKTQTEAMDQLFIDQMTGIFSNAGKALSDASSILGIDFDAMVDQLIINPMKLSLKDLESDAVISEIEAFFSSTLDGFAKTLLSSTDALEKYQKIGEGAFETMIRLAGEANFMKESFDSLRIAMPLTGMELVEVTQNIIGFAGGLDALQSSLTTYYDKFYTEQEKFETLTNRLTAAAGDLVETLPTTHAEFRNLIDSLDMTTEAGQEAFATLIGLSGAFDQYIKGLEAQKEAVEETTNFVESAFEALERSVEAERVRLNAILANVTNAHSALQKSVDAEQMKINEDHNERLSMLNAEKTVIQSLHKARIDNINDERRLVADNISALTTLSNSLMDTIHDLSIESKELSETRWGDAASKVSTALENARSGKLPMDGELSKVLSNLVSSQQGAFNSGFQEDYQTSVVQNELKELAKLTDEQLTSEERLLASLDRQANNAESYYQRSLLKIDEQIAQANQFHQEQTNALLAILKSAQDDIDSMNGVDNTVLALSESVDRFNVALNEAIANDVVAELSLLDDVLTYAEDQVDATKGIETEVINLNAAIANFSDAITKSNEETGKAQVTELRSMVAEMRTLREEAKESEKKSSDLLTKLLSYTKLTWEEYIDARNRARIEAEEEA